MPAGVTVVLKGDGWEAPVETDGSGYYAYLDIGDEVAFLGALVPDDRGDLVPLTSDLPVRITTDGSLVVNMAFHPRGVEPAPQLGLQVVAVSPQAMQTEEVSFEITVVNQGESLINQVIVADHVPEGLTYVSATSSQGSVLYDRGLVWAELGSLAGGTSATVSVVTSVAEDAAPGATIVNSVAAYHSENTAVQREAAISVVAHANNRLPVTGLASTLPLAAVFVVLLVWVAVRSRRYST
jgi:uncharacterized repeat protein (TIGR01451 family)